MSAWVRACLPRPIALSAELLKAGIAERLALLTYLFCPEDEEEPDVVLERLRIDSLTASPEGPSFLLRYRADDMFITLDSSAEPDVVQGSVDDLLERVARRSDPGATVVRGVLANTKQVVALALKVHDLDSMGWPLAIACAASLAKAGSGLVHADGWGWYGPDGREVAVVLEE
jgi:hypothetical protein